MSVAQFAEGLLEAQYINSREGARVFRPAGRCHTTSVHGTSAKGGGMNRRTRIVLTVAAALLLAVILIGAAPAKTTEAAGVSYHVVRYGETLSSISRWYGISVWSLACANGIYNTNFIYACQVLYVP